MALHPPCPARNVLRSSEGEGLSCGRTVPPVYLAMAGLSGLVWMDYAPGSFATATQRTGVLRVWNVSQRCGVWRFWCLPGDGLFFLPNASFRAVACIPLRVPVCPAACVQRGASLCRGSRGQPRAVFSPMLRR
jgi:hypothetical protein